MRTVLAVLALLTTPAAARAADSWVVATDLWGNTTYQTLVLEGEGAVSGTLGGDRVTGRRAGKALTLTVSRDGAQETFTGRIEGDRIVGSADMADTNTPAVRVRHAFTARKIETKPPGGPRRIAFAATSWSNVFSQHREPVLTIWPGDTVATSTLDSGGMDAKGVTRALYGNPQIGPFFVGGAEPGDTLAVRIGRLRLNRDFADSQDRIVGRALSTGLAAQAADLGKRVRWRLDLAAGTASPEIATGAMAGYAVPVRPMLGGLAVAPGGGGAPISTGDTGRFGGNMDFNEVAEGATVYLPVQQPGALLYMGDGHARQGDGETTQWALETSLDVEFTVDLIKGGAIQAPRVETDREIMALGQAPSLDEAVRSATEIMVQWLAKDYGLTLAQASEVLGVAARYHVVTLAGRNAGMVLRIDKALLPKRP